MNGEPDIRCEVEARAARHHPQFPHLPLGVRQGGRVGSACMRKLKPMPTPLPPDYRQIRRIAITAIFSDDVLFERVVLKGGNARANAS